MSAADRSCRLCGAALAEPVVDLGMAPLANHYLVAEELNRMEPFYPLRLHICEECFLVQLDEFESPERIFGDYAYFSSYADSWVEHARKYCEDVVGRFELDRRTHVVEIASNDGYLLQHFHARGIPCLGIEPASNVARAAVEKGLPTVNRFFDAELAQELASDGRQADLLVANNVLAHVPALNGFVRGLATLLKPSGILTIELPHLMRLIAEKQFDTIYHEHFSYFSLLTVERVLSRHGLCVFDVEELPTHGGSLRIYAGHIGHGRALESRVAALRRREDEAGLTRLDTYRTFSDAVRDTRYRLLDFLMAARRRGESVVAYGAPAKGNTLLNYCGIRSDLVAYTVDRSPHKQDRFLPGTHIPIYHPDRVRETRPDYVLILPWNFRDEVMTQMADITQWGGRFVVPIPEVAVVS